ncbi:MAG: choice-of-anchor J domain-containing protein [Tepidisphaeraceae bacterium]
MKRILASVAVAAVATTAFGSSMTQNFDTVVPAGWATQNNSSPIGTTNWFQGNPTVFPAQGGATSSYAGANFNNTTGTNTISNWLMSPQDTFNVGDTIRFYTRTVNAPAFPDRLQVRYSAAGASTNVGAANTDVGDFSNLMLDINPGYSTAVYPNVWTQFTINVTSAFNGRIAFRYFVENGGPTGANSDYIGIDTLEVTPGASDIPEPTTGLLFAGIAGLSLARRRR